jgi:hypothetical protein
VQKEFLVYKDKKLGKFTLLDKIAEMRDQLIPDFMEDNAKLKE